MNLLQQMQQGAPQQSPLNNINQVRSMMNAVRGCGNPMGMLNMLAQKNPNVKQAMDVAQKFASPQQAFYSEAQRMGIDPNSILNQLK